MYLKDVKPELSRPWDYPAAFVLLQDFRILVEQGRGNPNRVAFARRGDEISVGSMDFEYHMLRARGAAFFTLPLPKVGTMLTRRLERTGLVEFTSGAGYHWAAADLFVCEHPYYVQTNRRGEFELPAVPPGEYELFCWVRNWHLIAKERDPETGLVFRERYAAPVEKRAIVTLTAKATIEQHFTFRSTDFPTH